MYKHILTPIDNSWHSNLAIELDICLAQTFEAVVTGLHVYAGRLHDERFKQMEGGLPSRYQEKQVLETQRTIHKTLITDGLQTISESYLDCFQNRCEEAKVAFERKAVEGKNYVEILKEATSDSYDLVTMGVLGLGAVQKSLIGSVCERVVRKVQTDILVTKTAEPLANKFLVAIDGSTYATAALRAALELAQGLGARVEVVTVFDPHFHVKAFRSIAGVLSEKASQSFRFKDQERLHDEIINSGLEKIYRGYLEQAGSIASQKGQEVGLTLLHGKPFEEILSHVDKEKPSLLVLGRLGAHHTEGLEMGSNTENLLRLAPCNVLIVSGERSLNKEPLTWTQDAQARLQQVPEGVMREMTRQRVEHLAHQLGKPTVTTELMEAKYQQWAENSAPSVSEMSWTEEAWTRAEYIPALVRGMVIKAIEAYAKSQGSTEVTPKIMDEAKHFWEETEQFHQP